MNDDTKDNVMEKTKDIIAEFGTAENLHIGDNDDDSKFIIANYYAMKTTAKMLEIARDLKKKCIDREFVLANFYAAYRTFLNIHEEDIEALERLHERFTSEIGELIKSC